MEAERTATLRDVECVDRRGGGGLGDANEGPVGRWDVKDLLM